MRTLGAEWDRETETEGVEEVQGRSEPWSAHAGPRARAESACVTEAAAMAAAMSGRSEDEARAIRTTVAARRLEWDCLLHCTALDKAPRTSWLCPSQRIPTSSCALPALRIPHNTLRVSQKWL